jgi:hypothetical protein
MVRLQCRPANSNGKSGSDGFSVKDKMVASLISFWDGENLLIS